MGLETVDFLCKIRALASEVLLRQTLCYSLATSHYPLEPHFQHDGDKEIKGLFYPAPFEGQP
jgi:hypothetical protein